MQSEINTLLNDLLASWHLWAVCGGRCGSGYPGTAPGFDQSRASRQYDDTNGALDGALENSTMQAVDAAMDGVDQPWRTALSFHARNLVSRAHVWHSPRLPESLAERAMLLDAARTKLVTQLALRGILM